MNCESVTHVGTVSQTGLDVNLVAAADGTQTNTGIDISCTGADTNTHLKLSHDATNYCSFITVANGATKIQTEDSDGAAGHLGIEPDGDLKLAPKSGHLYVYDSDNADDYAKFDIGGNGNLEISTVDAAGADAHITLKPDGAALFEPATYTIFLNGNLHIGEKASATTDIAGYGQLWVKTASPNNLYFTDDEGNDKLISGVSSIISAMVFG